MQEINRQIPIAPETGSQPERNLIKRLVEKRKIKKKPEAGKVQASKGEVESELPVAAEDKAKKIEKPATVAGEPEIGGEKSGLPRRQDLPESQIAEEKIENFEKLRQEFEALKEELLGKETTAEKLNRGLPRQIVKVASGLRNITRMLADAVMAVRSREQKVTLGEVTVEATVLDRKTDFLQNSEFRDLLKVSGNSKALRELLNREVYREIPCERILMLKGLRREQLQALVSEMGYNPRAFFSDQRGENAGRIAIDNHLLDGEHPFAEELGGEIPEGELDYWQPVFPEAKRGFWKKWHKSRTHSVVYAAKDSSGADVMFLPVHVDPKNAVAAIAEAFRKRRRDEKSALAYHRTASGNDPEYVGTGLYDLGIAYLLKLLERQKNKGTIAGLTIEGADKLQTRFSITGDDRITWKTEEVVKSLKQAKNEAIG